MRLRASRNSSLLTVVLVCCVHPPQVWPSPVGSSLAISVTKGSVCLVISAHSQVAVKFTHYVKYWVAALWVGANGEHVRVISRHRYQGFVYNKQNQVIRLKSILVYYLI